MALHVKVAQRSRGLFQYRSRASFKRPLASFAVNRPSAFTNNAIWETTSKRCLSTAPSFRITGQEAASAQAYIKSEAIRGKDDLVAVKKVIVIGSGGLSIGQAGEFDYSGTYWHRSISDFEKQDIRQMQ